VTDTDDSDFGDDDTPAVEEAKYEQQQERRAAKHKPAWAKSAALKVALQVRLRLCPWWSSLLIESSCNAMQAMSAIDPTTIFPPVPATVDLGAVFGGTHSSRTGRPYAHRTAGSGVWPQDGMAALHAVRAELAASAAAGAGAASASAGGASAAATAASSQPQPQQDRQR
jgi:hypothetical protein